MARKGNRRNFWDSGLTVTEMMVTIFISAVLMGIAVPNFLSWLSMFRLDDAARQIATDLQLARMRAISQNTANTATFDAANGTYTFTLGTDSRDLKVLYPGITIAVAPANPGFNSRGTSTNAGVITITLSNASGTQRFVCVMLVGRVNIQNAACT